MVEISFIKRDGKDRRSDEQKETGERQAIEFSSQNRRFHMIFGFTKVLTSMNVLLDVLKFLCVSAIIVRLGIYRWYYE